MSDNSKRPGTEITPLAPSLIPGPPVARLAGGPDEKLEMPQQGPATNAVPAAPGAEEGLTEALARLEETRLPADVKEQILAELPPPEERERLYRELQEKGGLSFEEFFASLVHEIEPQP